MSPSSSPNPSFGSRALGLIGLIVSLCLLSCAPEEAHPKQSQGDGGAPSPPTMEPGNAPEADGPGPAKSDEVGQLFARAYHLDNLMGMPGEAEPLYQRVAREGRPAQRETALAQLRIATLCRIRGDRRCAMGALDWLINNADRHPSLARYAEQEMVELLHPQAGHSSALTRGPPVSFTRLLQVPAEVGKQFRDAEQALLKYVRVPLAPQLHNVDAVVAVKRGALLSAIRAYDPLSKSQFQNAVASGLFRQGSIHQDFAEALGRLKLPDELLAPVAARLRVKFHTESVTHFRSALEHYRKAAAIADPSAERWRQAAALAEAQLGRLARRQPGVK